MAAGPWTFYDSAKVKMMDGSFDFDGDTFVVVPLDNNYAPNAAADAALADVVANEVADGSASLRQTLANVTVTAVSNSQVVWDADDVVISSTDPVDIKYIAIFDDTDAADSLVCYFDTDTAVATGVRVTQLTIQFPNGIVRLS